MKKYGMMRNLSLVLCFALLTFATVACAADAPVRVMALKGPTGIGMVQLMDNSAYTFTLAGSPDEVVSAVASGSVDIAAVPTNLAAVLSQKTKGSVQLLALNTLGVLYILEKGEVVKDIKDLAGKTIVTSGQGAVPEYVLNYILEQNGLTDVTVEYKGEHSEVATLAASGMADIVMLPEPHVTSLLMKNADFHVALDVTEEFAKAAVISGNADTVLSMGCVIVRREFAEKNPEVIAKFLDDGAASVKFVNENVEAAAAKVAEKEILPVAAVAQKAIPQCNIVFITGAEMKAQVKPLFDILFAANPASVGGALPADDFYYGAE